MANCEEEARDYWIHQMLPKPDLHHFRFTYIKYTIY